MDHLLSREKEFRISALSVLERGHSERTLKTEEQTQKIRRNQEKNEDLSLESRKINEKKKNDHLG